MSMKPPKRGDQKNIWLQKRRDHVRSISPEYHLIITEGEKTDPLYFQRIKETINANFRDRIHLEVQGKGENTVNLFKTAKKIAELNPNGIRHVWIVYDTDSFNANSVNDVVELCKNASSDNREYHAVWSNQCIELWYLLHFAYYHTDIERSLYFPKLSKYLKGIEAGEYSKNRPDMYDVLRPYMSIAIQNAKKLEQNNIGKTPYESAPGTQVFQLIEKLEQYL